MKKWGSTHTFFLTVFLYKKSKVFFLNSFTKFYHFHENLLCKFLHKISKFYHFHEKVGIDAHFFLTDFLYKKSKTFLLKFLYKVLSFP